MHFKFGNGTAGGLSCAGRRVIDVSGQNTFGDLSAPVHQKDNLAHGPDSGAPPRVTVQTQAAKGLEVLSLNSGHDSFPSGVD